jgi:ankyrin repeat protein
MLHQLQAQLAQTQKELAAERNKEASEHAAASKSAQGMQAQLHSLKKRAQEAEQAAAKTEQIAIDSQINCEKAEKKLAELTRQLVRVQEKTDVKERTAHIARLTGSCSDRSVEIDALENEQRGIQAEPGLLSHGQGSVLRRLDRITQRLRRTRETQASQTTLLDDLKQKQQLQEQLWIFATDGNEEGVTGILLDDQGGPTSDVFVNAPDALGCTALFYACRQGHLGMVKLLLGYGADHAWTDCDTCPMAGAAQKGNDEVVEWLLGAGADLDSTDKYGNNALHVACFEARLSTVELLLSKGSFIDSKDNEGNTCLHKAAIRGQPEVTQLLLENGAHANIHNNDKKTPIALAIQHKRIGIVKIIRSLADDLASPTHRRPSTITFGQIQIPAASGFSADAPKTVKRVSKGRLSMSVSLVDNSSNVSNNNLEDSTVLSNSASVAGNGLQLQKGGGRGLVVGTEPM